MLLFFVRIVCCLVVFILRLVFLLVGFDEGYCCIEFGFKIKISGVFFIVFSVLGFGLCRDFVVMRESESESERRGIFCLVIIFW